MNEFTMSMLIPHTDTEDTYDLSNPYYFGPCVIYWAKNIGFWTNLSSPTKSNNIVTTCFVVWVLQCFRISIIKVCHKQSLTRNDKSVKFLCTFSIFVNAKCYYHWVLSVSGTTQNITACFRNQHKHHLNNCYSFSEWC